MPQDGSGGPSQTAHYNQQASMSYPAQAPESHGREQFWWVHGNHSDDGQAANPNDGKGLMKCCFGIVCCACCVDVCFNLLSVGG